MPPDTLCGAGRVGLHEKVRSVGSQVVGPWSEFEMKRDPRSRQYHAGELDLVMRDGWETCEDEIELAGMEQGLDCMRS